MSEAFWNIIHDGGINAIDGCVPGDLTLAIGIQYMCDQLPTAADSLVAVLRGCRRFEYTPFGKPAISDLHQIAAASIEVLSAKECEGEIEVCCVNGMLRLAYGKVEVRLKEGPLVSQAELEAAANRSVAEWLEANKSDPAAG